MVGHAPVELASLGTLLLESRRHFLDLGEMTVAECASIGEVLSRVYRLLKKHTGAERIYQLSTMEGQPHFHAWLVPRRKGISERGLKFLARDDTCSLADVVALAGRLRYEMAVGQSA